jgi:hypothetical protein
MDPAARPLEGEVARSRRSRSPLSCCVVGLGGIASPDEVGEALRRTVREYDSVGRVGADKFVIVLPETGGPDCQGVAGRIRKAACEAHAASTVKPLEISVGIAEWNGTDSAAELLEAADETRRTAQREGGGTVVRLRPGAPVEGLSAFTDHLARAAGIAEKAAQRARQIPGEVGDQS